MILTNEIRHNGSIPDLFKLSSTSSNSEYPFYALQQYENVGEEFLYYRPLTSRYRSMLGRYDHLFESLYKEDSINKFEFVYNDNQEYIHVTKHCIMDVDGRILLLMTFAEKDLFLENRMAEEAYEDVSKFKLYVSTDMLLVEKYSNVWKKLEKDYVSLCYTSGIDVQYTSSEKIDQKIFSPALELEFENLDMLMLHLKEDVPELLKSSFLDGDDIGQEREIQNASMYEEGSPVFNNNSSFVITDGTGSGIPVAGVDPFSPFADYSDTVLEYVGRPGVQFVEEVNSGRDAVLFGNFVQEELENPVNSETGIFEVETATTVDNN